jgi:putative transposase
MKKQRKQYSAAMKAKVALEAIKGNRTVQEIASNYGVHPNQVAQWKKLAMQQLPEVFSNGRKNLERSEEELRARLYQQIGKLQVELEWLKKKTGFGG